MGNIMSMAKLLGRKPAVAVSGKYATAICVFCASTEGKTPAHLGTACSLATAMHSANACLVYGGGTSGLMCEVAGNLVKLSGTESVRGVTCKQLMAKERKPGAEDATGPVEASKPESYGDLTVMDSLSARKDLMIGCVNEYPDSTGGFVALSGGFGMADEVMYVIAGRNLGMHKKRVVLVNVEGHWDHILAWARQAQDGRFVRASTMEWVLKAKSAEEAVRMLLE